MKSAILVLSFLVLGVSGHRAGLAASGQAREASLEASWSHDLNAAGVTPIQRVVALLKKMQDELEKEAANDSEMYDKMVCWCETNEKEKTKAIADAEAKIADLEAEIEERSASSGGAMAEIANLKKQIAEDTAALKKAEAIREKGLGEFRDEETDLVQTITNLRNAVAVLAKHNGGSLLQIEAPVVAGMRVLLRNAALEHEELEITHPSKRPLQTALLAVSTGAHRKSDNVEAALVDALNTRGSSVPESLPMPFAQKVVADAAKLAPLKASGNFLQAPVDADYKSYSSRSNQIYGIMTQMLEEFEAQLSAAQKDEMKAGEDAAAVAKAKKEQIAVAKEKLDDMEGEHSANIKALSDAKEDLGLTREQRSKDVEFLRNLKVTCGDLDTQWERRSATRSAEITAVAETIAILTEDDNREALAKTSLLQKSATSTALRRSNAAAALRKAARAPEFDADDLLAAWHHRHGAPTLGAVAGPRAQLSVLATSVQLDSFTKVKAMMDEMVANLKKEQQEEVDFKAYCTKELDENEKAAYAKSQQIKDLEGQLEKLAALMAKLAKEIAQAQADVAETKVQIKKASEVREGENAEFQTTIADQRATQTILAKALMRLKDFYKKGIGKKVLTLAQQTPPVQFNKYKNNAGASPVMGLIEQIIEDSKKVESEATAAEYQAQSDYEKFINDSNAIIKGLNESISAKKKATAQATEEIAEANGDLEASTGELDSLKAYEADLHGECDFVLKNFDIRQKARLQEMEAIQAAKAILSGAGSSF
jgi:hypothetical protein